VLRCVVSQYTATVSDLKLKDRRLDMECGPDHRCPAPLAAPRRRPAPALPPAAAFRCGRCCLVVDDDAYGVGAGAVRGVGRWVAAAARLRIRLWWPLGRRCWWCPQSECCCPSPWLPGGRRRRSSLPLWSPPRCSRITAIGSRIVGGWRRGCGVEAGVGPPPSSDRGGGSVLVCCAGGVSARVFVRRRKTGACGPRSQVGGGVEKLIFKVAGYFNSRLDLSNAYTHEISAIGRTLTSLSFRPKR